MAIAPTSHPGEHGVALWRTLAAEGRGVLIYATGHEGRGIGLIDKLRAYMEQEAGADTLDANLRLGLPPDGRHYDDAAAVLDAVGIRSIRLITNNPGKVEGLQSAGITVEEAIPLPASPHLRNRRYLHTKQDRFGHVQLIGDGLPAEVPGQPVDIGSLLGAGQPSDGRPFVLLKYAQTLDGRIVTADCGSKWISSEAEVCRYRARPARPPERGRAPRVARPARRLRCRTGRSRHRAVRRPPAHRPHGPRPLPGPRDP